MCGGDGGDGGDATVVCRLFTHCQLAVMEVAFLWPI